MADETPNPDEAPEAVDAITDAVTEPNAESELSEGAPEAGGADAAPAQVADEGAVEPEAVPDEAETAAPVAGADQDDVDADDADGGVPVRPDGAIPGAHLDVDLVLEDSATGEGDEFGYVEDGESAGDEEEDLSAPILDVTIDLSAAARYRATGKRKRAIARVTLKPGTGAYTINGRELDVYFPRPTLRRTIRQALEVVGQDAQLDVVATITGSGNSAQADALRHGISRALLVAQPNLRGELKKRGFLTRDARAVERKKAGLKKARKRPQFSKR